MKIEFDPQKDIANRKRHGLSLADAAELEWDAAQAAIDRRFPYDELRMMAVVPKGVRLYHVAYVERGAVLRIISLRLASRREVRGYAENC
ncbi:BrnT family toxin [Pseudoduganella namucuonensis]|uniref:BrnT family toxin n=1 Tax=Pseudoduganella namucuonensis TaxID=1035707 RepID=A0A1I7LAJ1_9BURK|nr:BrnT family toxin [Pseudoduganella namucuonensis]SFV06729.1 hypothetical protein SAMN05216552_1025103 [Pseudoduganella namucuonensis]